MIQIRQAGDAALLLDVTAAPPEEKAGNVAARVAAAIRAAALRGVVDVVPAAATVLVSVEPGSWEIASLAARLGELASAPAPPLPAASTAELVLDTVYDGPDLAEVAALTGLTVADVITRHSDASYRVGWLGFSPGFGYLTGLDPVLAAVGRLATPRVAVPAGSVAIAGGFAAVYPNSSPGGWRLLARTAAVLWDPDRDSPAVLSPGRRVRFRPAGQMPQPAAEVTRLRPLRPSGVAAERWIEVLQPGPMTTVQDLGRAGLAHLGVPGSGAADAVSLRRANLLAGNPPGAAGLEVTLGRLALRFATDAVVAVTGAPVSLALAAGDTEREPAFGAAFVVPAAAVLRLGTPPTGLRSYLAIDGGVDVAPVLGSRSADRRSGLGPPPLRPGERLPVGRPRSPDEKPAVERPRTVGPGHAELRTILGPRDDWFSAAALATLGTASYQVSPASDRTGLRLDGPPLERAPGRAGELPSEGTAAGSLQVTHDGQPILLLADHPTTGGYPVIAVVESADLGLAGQLRPGQSVRFAVSPPGLPPGGTA